MQTEKEKGLSIGSSKKKILIKYYYERIRRDVTNFIKWMLLAILTGLVVGGQAVHLQPVSVRQLNTETVIYGYFSAFRWQES